MKSLHKFLVAVLTGAVLSLAATAALADGHGHRGHYDERGWEHRHYRHGPPPVYYRGGPAVYAPYYAPAPIYYAPPPPVVYQPHYYAPRPAPAVPRVEATGRSSRSATSTRATTVWPSSVT